MKNRKGVKQYAFDDGAVNLSISDEKPVWGERAVWSTWGDEPYKKTVVKFDTETATDADWSRYQDALLIWERDQRALTEVTTRKAAKTAGNESAVVRGKKKKRLQDEWLSVARESRRLNAAISIAEIARKIARHMNQMESDFNFNPHRKSGTIENFLHKNLKKTEK